MRTIYVPLIVVIVALALWIATVGTIAYVVWHFISKYW